MKRLQPAAIFTPMSPVGRPVVVPVLTNPSRQVKVRSAAIRVIPCVTLLIRLAAVLGLV